MPRLTIPPLTLLLAAWVALAPVTLSPLPAEARTSSGGYSRPSIRTPSISPRAPSLGDGYRRPSLGGGSTWRAPSSPGDLGISRRGSAEALRRFRTPQPEAAAPPPMRTPEIARRQPSYGGWSLPSYAAGSARRSFGLWDGVFLWFLLDTLTRPGHAEFFHDNQNDPGYRQWRAEADRRADDDPALRARLAQLDRELQTREGTQRDPGTLPPDVTRDQALADSEQGSGVSLLPIVIGGGALFVLWLWRRRSARREGPNAVGTASGILRRKMANEPYTPQRFRVGMTITLDPTPFLLAQGVTKVTAPQASGGDILIGVEAIGTLSGSGDPQTRLYLPGNAGFFQLHLAPTGEPDECRFFTLIDEVSPATEEEWAFWLGETDGMIGWGEFETKDGKRYDRVWSPGPPRVPPVRWHESRDAVDAMHVATHDAMLYAAPTGAAEPAPQVEYILVAAIEEAGQARVEIRAGIDVNPAALSLS